MDYDLTRRFAVRVFQVDYIHTTLFSETQNNYRFSTGLVYRWGAIKKKGHRIAFSDSVVRAKCAKRDLSISRKEFDDSEQTDGLLATIFALAWLASCGGSSSSGGSSGSAGAQRLRCRA